MHHRAFETMNRKMKCDLGSKCKHPHLDVRNNHHCHKCEKLLHVFCAARTGEEDHILFCGQCDDNQSDPVVHRRRSLRNTRGKGNKSVSELQKPTHSSITGVVVTRSTRSGTRIVSNKTSEFNKKKSSSESNVVTNSSSETGDEGERNINTKKSGKSPKGVNGSERGEEMDQDGNTDPDEVISPSVECTNDNKNTHSIPTIITEESECPNYLISTITQSDNGDWRYLDKEYFFTKKQRRNDVIRKKE